MQSFWESSHWSALGPGSLSGHIALMLGSLLIAVLWLRCCASGSRWLLHQRAKLKPKKDELDLFRSSSQQQQRAVQAAAGGARGALSGDGMQQLVLTRSLLC
jgi:hypothetical protein